MKKLIFISFISIFCLSFTSFNILQDRILVEIDNQSIQGIGDCIAQGADVNGFSSTGFTPLLYAVVRQKPTSIDYLLSQGARPDFRGRSGLSPFSIAKSKGDEDLFLKLYKALETLGKVDQAMIELEARCPEAKTEAKEADRVFVEEETDCIPKLIKAVVENDCVSFNKLIAEGVDVNITDSEDATALLYAAFFKRIDFLKILIQKGANLDWQDKDAYSALMLAANTNNIQIVELLINAGANPNLQNNEGKTALMFAASNAKTCSEIVAFLIKNNADLDIKDNEGLRFYSYAAK